MGIKQAKKGHDIEKLQADKRIEKAPARHNQIGHENGLGQADDYLYVISDGKFYRLSPSQVKAHPIDAGDATDRAIVDALRALQHTNAVVADLQAPGAVAASCACVALNIDVFDGTLQRLAKGH